MRELDYRDTRGRMWRVLLPDEAQDSEAEQGVPVGPLPVGDALGLPEPVATRLHNELYRRGLFRLRDVRARPRDVQAALQAALRVDAQAIMNAFEQLEKLGTLGTPEGQGG